MPECRYCDASFDDEATYRDHLREAHEGELGPIDRRRAATAPSASLPVGPLAIAVVVLAAAGVVGYVVFLSGGAGSGAGDDPRNVGSVHYHGTIEVVIDGHQVDFSRPEYQQPREHPAFHFEGGDGDRWHVHAQGVTLAYAMDTLGIGVAADAVTFQGTSYGSADPDTTVAVTVHGGPVTPAEYVLREGDAVRIVVGVD